MPAFILFFISCNTENIQKGPGRRHCPTKEGGAEVALTVAFVPTFNGLLSL